MRNKKERPKEPIGRIKPEISNAHSRKKMAKGIKIKKNDTKKYI